MISAQTKVYSVWGHPISHSLSPRIHNQAFQQQAIDAVYVAFDVHPDRLPEAIAGARELGLAGFNLTIPHKQLILDHLDEIDPLAAQIGAVNTVVVNNGKMVGYNTDACGFTQPLKQKLGFNAKLISCVLLGSGGASRAIAFQLASEGADNITLLNRTSQKAAALAEDLSASFPDTAFSAAQLEEPVQHSALETCDLLVQCTSRGLNDEPLDVDWTRLNANAIVADIVYGTDAGPFLRQAEAHEFRIFEGIWMLLGQAAMAFEIWTGQSFAIDHARSWIR